MTEAKDSARYAKIVAWSDEDVRKKMPASAGIFIEAASVDQYL
jgi:hypothetical protein